MPLILSLCTRRVALVHLSATQLKALESELKTLTDFIQSFQQEHELVEAQDQTIFIHSGLTAYGLDKSGWDRIQDELVHLSFALKVNMAALYSIFGVLGMFLCSSRGRLHNFVFVSDIPQQHHKVLGEKTLSDNCFLVEDSEWYTIPFHGEPMALSSVHEATAPEMKERVPIESDAIDDIISRSPVYQALIQEYYKDALPLLKSDATEIEKEQVLEEMIGKTIHAHIALMEDYMQGIGEMNGDAKGFFLFWACLKPWLTLLVSRAIGVIFWRFETFTVARNHIRIVD
jgi:hypothetical protein